MLMVLSMGVSTGQNRGNNIGLSKYQLLWHSKRIKSGGKCFILHLTEKHEHIEILEVRDSRSRSRFPFPVLVSLVSYHQEPCSPVLHPGTRVREGLEEAVVQMSRLQFPFPVLVRRFLVRRRRSIWEAARQHTAALEQDLHRKKIFAYIQKCATIKFFKLKKR